MISWFTSCLTISLGILLLMLFSKVWLNGRVVMMQEFNTGVLIFETVMSVAILVFGLVALIRVKKGGE